MATAILETLKRQRSNIKRNITRIRGMVDAKEEEEQKSPAELQCRLGILESYFKQALSVQSEIETMESTDSGRADLEDSYITTKLAIQQLLGEDLHNTVFDNISAPSYSAPSRLPRLALPSFDGNHKDYKNFISSFLQLVNREQISNIDKFNHLRNCLKGPALEAVAAFPVTGENYAKALERLKDRYDKPALIFVETIAPIFKLPPAAASNLCIIPQISYQPDLAIDVSTWKLPENTPLADERFYQSRHVDLLLGTEAFFDALTVGQIRLGPQGPLLQKTQFGWVVTGRLQQTATIEVSTCMALNASSIDVNLKRLWELEAVDSPPLQKPEHAICEEQYEKTTCLDSTGRIVVKLPFKADPTRLGDSFDIARRRFLSMERRLSKSPALRQQYCDFMEEYEKLGHMSPVIHPKLHEPHYYIPHHCVLKPSSESTKLRVVFDASCRTSNQLSLNDLLCVGPTLQEDLYLQLLKFRLHRYAITADVTKMYRQPPHFWQHVASTTSLMFIKLTVKSAAIIKSSFYVDDLLTGADDLETLRIIKDQVTEILRRGHFPLTKWHSNYVGFMEDHASKKLSSCGEGLASALGVNWNQHKDTLFFKFIPRNHATRITKRSILSTASALFDPLGLLSPLVVVAKILLQELWLAGLQWDESVPENIHTAWSKCLESFQTVSILSIPRYCLQHKMRSLQLHGFCDTSIRAYGCCVYLRSETSTGDVAVQLLTGKSRVAPVKKKSLPKLELCGAHLLGQLYAKLKPLLADRKFSVYFWTDSQIVLHWLKQHSVTLSAFVGNRISEIQEWTADGQWKFVPGESNPADIVSREAATTELAASM
ncbi:uncharacterized protein [Drosophila takahashii]|uniref:uncharacterized protein n=1 Tax=Drosophila takahashii TaxID=29030 RepID=UPI003899575A